MRYLLIVAILIIAGMGWAKDRADDAKACWPKSISEKWKCGDYIQNIKAMGCDMRDKELIEAAEGVLPYLTEGGGFINVYPVYKTPAQSLRDQADEIERRDAAIRRFREAVKKAKGGDVE